MELQLKLKLKLKNEFREGFLTILCYNKSIRVHSVYPCQASASLYVSITKRVNDSENSYNNNIPSSINIHQPRVQPRSIAFIS